MVTSPPDGSTRPTAAASVTAFAATAMEARPLRRRLEGSTAVRVYQGGVALSRWTAGDHDVLLSCGLAGALAGDLETGTVLIPDAVGDGAGRLQACDAGIVALLRDAARRCGITPHPGHVVTVDHFVAGSERALWAGRGYAAVDMESALLVGHARRFAVLRVVLDTPRRELSPAWARPRRAIAAPWLWGEALWLARVAPGLCDVGARVVAEAFSPTPTARDRGTFEPQARPGA
jgi:Phosphorylase superfamily